MLNKNNNKEINNEKTNKTIDLDQKTKEILLRHKEITKEIEMDENELKKMYDEENKSIKKVEDIIQKTLEISIDLQNQAEENKNIENDILNFEDNYNQGLISSAEYEMPLLETGIDNSFPKLKNYINKTSFNNYLKDQELLLSLIAKAYSKDAFIQFKEQFNNWKNNLEDIVTNLDRYGDFIKVIKDIDISLTIVGPNFVIFTNKKNTHIGFLNYLYEVLESKEIQNDIIESHLGNKIKFYFIENIEEIKKAIDHFNTLNTEEKNKYKELSIENNFKKKDNKLLSFFKKAAATKKGK
ncbi:hypothetical protein ACLRE7_02925 [Mycoplasmopsis meleagridis]|uniref:hypothetical protein n=1 Tax=Mycoplasmopsis meleagridis TaxID=29561 RepID=UPI003A881484